MTHVLRYFHGGLWDTGNRQWVYRNAECEKFGVDPDTLCFWDISANVKDLGYNEDCYKSIYYRVPGSVLNGDCLLLVANDASVNGIREILEAAGTCDIYVDHTTCEAELQVVQCNTKPIGEEATTAVEDAADSGAQEADNGGLQDAAEEDQYLEDLEIAAIGVEEVVDDGDDLGEDGEGPGEEDEDNFIFNSEVQEEHEVDEEIEEIRNAIRQKQKRPVGANQRDEAARENATEEVGEDFVAEADEEDDGGKLSGHESDYMDSDDPGEYGDEEMSDDERGEDYIGRSNAGPVYDPSCVIPIWEVDMRFEDHNQFKDALRKYAFAKGVVLKFKKNSTTRTRVHCRKGCPWVLYASKDSRNNCYTIKTYHHKHKCFRSNKNPLLTCKYIVDEYRERIMEDPKILVKQLKDLIKREKGVYATYQMCQRARRQVLKEKRGSYIDEFATLWGYAAELIHTNPGSTVSVQVKRNDEGQAVFHRMYICFQALKEGWKAGCRPFVGVDGCFLKSITKGEMLVAVGRDANNQMFPIAWAVVEVENKSSWKWFLEKLFNDIGHPGGAGLTLMSDQQKGLVKVITEDFPELDHRECSRHIYMNWLKKWKGINRKKQYYACVKSTFVQKFDQELRLLEAMGEGSVQDLLETPVKMWAKCYQNSQSKCDATDNNMAEAFNSWVAEPRGMNFRTMLDTIRKMVMERMNGKTDWAQKWRTNISPDALKKLEHQANLSTYCRSSWNGHGQYEVIHDDMQHIVDMNELTCSCRAWELSGIPCCHAISCMYQEEKSPEGYVSHWYTKEKYLAAYGQPIFPIRGEIFWVRRDDPILPPEVKQMPGRPKKKRNKSKDEPKKSKFGKASKVGIKMSCSICKSYEHNKAKCPNRPQEEQTIKGKSQETAKSSKAAPAKGNKQKGKAVGDNNSEEQQKNKRQKSGSKTKTVQTQVEPRQTKSMALNSRPTASAPGPVTRETVLYEPKSSFGVGVLHDLKTGKRTLNPGTKGETILTSGTVRKIVGDDMSKYDYHHKGKGLKWAGKRAVTTRQLVQEHSDEQRKRQAKRSIGMVIGTQASQTDSNKNVD